MKRYKNFGRKFLSGLFIFGMISHNVFFFFPKFANAQAESSGGIGAYFGGSLDIGGLGATVISCAFPNGIVNAIGGLFNGGSTGDTPAPTQQPADDKEPQTFDMAGGGMSMDTVPVNDQAAIDSIKEADKNLTQNKDKKKGDKENETGGAIDQGNPPEDKDKKKDPDGVLVDIRAEEEKDTKKERCLDKIAKYLATKLLDEITLATVDWINSGFEGQPLYLTDPEGFFNNIATEEINLVTGVFTDPQRILEYPFGQVIMTSILQGLQQDFYHEAQFSLNEVLAHGTYEEFHEDFSIGGWAGYTALFETNNNPFGQYFDTQDHLSRQIAGTSHSTAIDFKRELNESGGFLSQRRCIMSQTGEDDYIASDDESEGQYYVPSGGPVPDAVYAHESVNYDTESGVPPTEDQADAIDVFVMRSQCAEWKNMTPGGVISDQIKNAVNIPNEELLLVDELNESIGLIIDALLTQLVTQGLESLSDTNPDNNVLLQQVQGSQPGSVANGIEDPPTTTDIITGGGMIDYSLTEIQDQYILNAQMAVPLLGELILKIRALDYCVPGPNPRWITNAEDSLVTRILAIPQFLAQPVDSDNQDGIEQDEVDAANAANEAHYADLIESLTGVQIVEGPNMDRYEEFFNFMENVFIKYNQRMQDQTATPRGFSLTQAPPSVRVLLDGLFNDLDNYTNQLNFMNDYLINYPNIQQYLADIEAALADIQSQSPDGILDENDPEVQAWLSAYDQISDQIVSDQVLQDLVAAIGQYTALLSVMDDHITSCIAQTTSGGYSHSKQRVPYPTPYTNYPAMPNPNNNGFLPGVSLGNGGGNSIDVTFGGVNITGNSGGLDTFEDWLNDPAMTVY